MLPLCDTLLLPGLWKPGNSCQGSTPGHPQEFVLRCVQVSELNLGTGHSVLPGELLDCCLCVLVLMLVCCIQWVLSTSLWMGDDSAGEWINPAALCKWRLPCQDRMGWQREPLISGSRRGHPPVFWEVCSGGAGPAWCSMHQISIVGECFKVDLAKPVVVSYHIKLVTEAGNC